MLQTMHPDTIKNFQTQLSAAGRIDEDNLRAVTKEISHSARSFYHPTDKMREAAEEGAGNLKTLAGSESARKLPTIKKK